MPAPACESRFVLRPIPARLAKRLKKRRGAPSPRWHLDEMVCWIGGKRTDLWRAVDDEGEVLDLVVQRGRDTEAALRLLKRLLHNPPVEPETRRRPHGQPLSPDFRAG